jgi:hypothetical protein
MPANKLDPLKQQVAQAHARGARPRLTGIFLTFFFYLPATFTTLFVLAASLLLGLI